MSWEYIRNVFKEWAAKGDIRDEFATRDGGTDYCAFTAINTNPVYNGIRIVLYPRSKDGKGKLEINSTPLMNLSELENYCNDNDNGFKIAKKIVKERTVNAAFVKPYGSFSYDDINTEQALINLLNNIRNFFKNDLNKIKEIVDSHPELKGRAPKSSKESKGNKVENGNTTSSQDSRQIIYFGAPGTSKSYTLNKDAEKEDELGNKVFTNQERVTFYPGYSYQQFVGTYKPCMVKSKDKGEDKIAYKFVPGPLLRLLEKALKAEKAKAEKAETQDKNKEDTPAAQTSTENQENGKEEKDTEKFLLIVEELNRAEAAAVFGDLFQLLDRNSDGESEYPISVSEDLKQYLRRRTDKTDKTDKTDEKDCGVWADVPEDEQKKLYFPSNFYIWATMNSADQGVFPLDTAFKRRWDFKYFGINDAEKELKKGVPQFWNELRKTINKELHDKLKLNEDKLLGPFFMKVEENIDEQTFWERFCSKVLLYLYEDAARLKRSQIFKEKTYSEIYNAFKEIKSKKKTLQETWNKVFCDVKLDDELKYPWPKAKAEEGTSSAPKADGNETAGETGTKNSDEMTDEQ